MQHSILVLGSGGHGIESISEYLESIEHSKIHISYVPADYGGSTGTLLRLLDLNGFDLNITLHGNASHPRLPFGDITKYISRKISKHKKIGENGENKNYLDLRSDDLEELTSHGKDLCQFFELDNQESELFVKYLEQYFTYYQKNRENNVFEMKTNSLGNIWHLYRYYQEGGMFGINRFYQQKKVLPTNQFLLFTSYDRQILVGSTISDEYLLGEDEVDVAEKAILPYSLKLRDSNGSAFGLIVSEEFLKTLRDVDLIIIPTGSVANWICLINSSSSVREILKEKGMEGKIVVLANLFYSQNEFPFEVYMELIVENYEIPIHVLSPDLTKLELVFRNNKEKLEKYYIENKKPNGFNSVRFKNILNNPYVSHSPFLECAAGEGIIGIKYATDSISRLLRRIYPSIE